MKKTARLISLITIATVTPAMAALNITFTSESLSNTPSGYLGGWYGNSVGFSEWVGNGSDVEIADGVLTVGTSNNYRGAAFVIDSSSLSGAGNYLLQFDVSRYVGGSNNFGQVNIWSGSGYDLSGTTADALRIHTEEARAIALGNASSNQLAEFSFQGTLANQSIAFTYDGSSALVLMFGANTSGWPFPEVDYDNIRMLSISPIPEPATVFWALALSGLAMLRRRPRA